MVCHWVGRMHMSCQCREVFHRNFRTCIGGGFDQSQVDLLRQVIELNDVDLNWDLGGAWVSILLK